MGSRIARRGGAVMALALVALSAPSSLAQQPPIPPEPVYPQGAPQQQQAWPPGQVYRQPSPAPGYQQPSSPQGYRPALSPQQQRCIELEQRLANDWTRGQQSQSQLPQIEAEIRKQDQIYQSTQAQAERTGCYESVFIFGRALVRTPRCIGLHQRIEEARRQLARLEQQRNAASRGGGAQNRQDEIIRELARNGCGDQYSREARNRDGGFFSWFGGTQQYEAPRRGLQTSRIVPFATYRTLCVRTCDGYYFPISYSTLPNAFPVDASACQQRCAAPAELFVYRNPGEEAEQMVSLNGQAYSDLPNAWRYRKEYIKGCSCKQTEYDPAQLAAADTQNQSGTQAQGQAGAQQAPQPQAQQPRPQ